MNDQELREAIAKAKAEEAADRAALTAALPVLDKLAARTRAGNTRDTQKAITAAGRAADGIRAVLANRYGLEV